MDTLKRRLCVYTTVPKTQPRASAKEDWCLICPRSARGSYIARLRVVAGGAASSVRRTLGLGLEHSLLPAFPLVRPAGQVHFQRDLLSHQRDDQNNR